MSTTTREQRAKLEVQGWIRRNIKQLNLIPTELIELCVLFYLHQMVFYKEKHGDGLEFDDEKRTVTFVENTLNTKHYYIYRTCVFGDVISAKYCDSFHIGFKWMKGKWFLRHSRYIMIGYITDTIDKSITDWNERLGLKGNKTYSRGIFSGPGYDQFFLFKDDGFVPLMNKTKIKNRPKEGDEFKLSFDFKKDSLSVYHENMFITKTELNGVKHIIIAMTLTYEGQMMKVTKWKFCKGNTTWC